MCNTGRVCVSVIILAFYFRRQNSVDNTIVNYIWAGQMCLQWALGSLQTLRHKLPLPDQCAAAQTRVYHVNFNFDIFKYSRRILHYTPIGCNFSNMRLTNGQVKQKWNKFQMWAVSDVDCMKWTRESTYRSNFTILFYILQFFFLNLLLKISQRIFLFTQCT